LRTAYAAGRMKDRNAAGDTTNSPLRPGGSGAGDDVHDDRDRKPLPDPDHPVVVGDRCLGGPLPEPGAPAGLRRDAPLPLPGAVRAAVAV